MTPLLARRQAAPRGRRGPPRPQSPLLAKWWQIVEELPTLGGPADVFAALLYYHDHKNEIDANLVEDAALAARYERDRHAK